MFLDGVADISKLNTGFDHFNTDFHAFMTYACQPLCGDRGGADKEHLAGVAMKAVLYDGDIYIHGIPFFDDLVTGYAVAHNVIDRGADGFRETAVIERSRD